MSLAYGHLPGLQGREGWPNTACEGAVSVPFTPTFTAASEKDDEVKSRERKGFLRSPDAMTFTLSTVIYSRTCNTVHTDPRSYAHIIT